MMKSNRFIKVILLFVIAFILPASLCAQEVVSYRHASNKLIIKLKSNVNDQEIQSIKNRYDFLGFKKMGIKKTFLMTIPHGSARQFAKTISKLPSVEYAEPDYVIEKQEMTNDPSVIDNSQWNMFQIKAAGEGESAWTYAKGKSNVNIAIIDTGIDQDHEDLSSKITLQKNCTSSPNFDDLDGHGTHVAGIAGAVTNNNKGVAGVGYNTSLINAKSIADNGSGYYSWVSDCIVWAADNGADVISISLGGSSDSKTLKNAIEYASQKGAVLVCSAGNSGNKRRNYPAYYSQCIAVASVDKNDTKSYFSNYDSKWVDVAAPGASIYSTFPNHYNSHRILNYGALSGTSMSTPHVSGLAGLIIGLNKDFTSGQVREYIEANADQIAGTGNYWKWGRINAYKSVQDAISDLDIDVLTPTPTQVNPTSTPIPTPTSILPTTTLTPPIATPTEFPPTPTVVISSPTPTPTIPEPTPTIIPPNPTPTPWWCIYFPSFCR